MKKTLALLLALFTIFATVSLASCSKKEKENDEGNDIPDFNFDDPSVDASDATGDTTDESGNVVNKNDFVTATGTAYILHPVEVRKDPKNSSSSVGVAQWASTVTLKERNATWSKIEFSDGGVTTEGYVRNELLTTDAKKITLKALETPAAAKIANLGTKQDGTAYTLNVRTTPWNCSASEEYPNVNVLANIGNEKYQVKDGDAVEKMGTTEDGEWAYIRFTKTVDGVEKVEWGWCAAKYVVVEGEVTGGEPVDPNTPPTIAPVK